MNARRNRLELPRTLLLLGAMALAFLMTSCHGLHHFSYRGGHGPYYSHHNHHHHHHYVGGRRFHR